MLKKIIGFVSLLLSGAWWLGIGREFIKAAIFDRILHMLNPEAWPIATMAFQYGPPVLLAALGLYLLARGSAPATTATTPVTDSPRRGIVDAGDTTPRGAKLITLGQYIIVASAIAAIIGILIGVALIIIGDRQNAAQHNKAVNSLVEAAKKVVEVFTPTIKPDVITEQERVFVPPELTPERLFSFYQDNTAIQAAELVKPHIGHWMKVIGTLGNVRPWTGHSSQVTFEHSSKPVLERTWLDYTTIYMYFRDALKIDRLRILKRGDKITVIGQLREVDAVDLHLDNCELAA
jgi:hypothetical protein